MNIPTDRRYTPNHEWMRKTDRAYTTGITDHAQAEMSDVVYVELPSIGSICEAGQAVAVVESVKAASDIYAPCSGEITAVNEALREDPGLINRDPYGEGWIYQVNPQDCKQIEELLSAEVYQKHIS